MGTAAKVVVGLLFGGTIVAVASAGGGKKSNGGRKPFVLPIPVPGVDIPFSEIDAAMCLAWEAGAREANVLGLEVLKRLWPDVPWPAKQGDHQSVMTTSLLIAQRVVAFLNRIEAGEVVCGEVGPPKPPPEQPPKPPDPKKKNYVGSGFNWPHKDRFPNERAFGLFLEQLGYVAMHPAAADFNIVSPNSLTVVRKFQRDYNKARKTQSIDQPMPSSLSTDGLIGSKTITAMLNAERWVHAMNVPWFDIVDLEDV